MTDYLTRTNNGTSFVGSDVPIFQCIAIASALKLYALTGMKANRAYTPKNMMLTASRLTGKKYKARDYMIAAQDLRNMADEAKLRERNPS